MWSLRLLSKVGLRSELKLWILQTWLSHLLISVGLRLEALRARGETLRIWVESLCLGLKYLGLE